MAPTQPCAKFQYVVTSNGPKILPVEDSFNKDEESPADYNAGGYLQVKVGDTFNKDRYHVIRKLGWGHFSTVWLVKDIHDRCHSALKVVKSAGRYAETARDEIKLLSRVAKVSPEHPGRSHIVSFLDSFVNQGPESSHVCIVFEPLGENLLAMIERNKKKGVSKALVKVIAKQILLGLQYLHDECDLVHTDIKPENILIAIPDVEAHIYNELSQSPNPTSRRVGVPLPTKSRGGVTIPRGQQRSRRQVQIFDSQPLSSPIRSVDIARSGPVSMSTSMGAGNGWGDESNSMPASYLAQMHLSKLGSASASGITKGLNTVASKPNRPLNPSAADRPEGRSFSAKNSPVHNPLSSSTSSSSLSSTEESTTAGSSSIISTPPTSLSHSLGNVVAGFMAMSKISSIAHIGAMSAREERTKPKHFHVKESDGKSGTIAGNELEEIASTGWKDRMLRLRPSTNKVTPSMRSSYKSPSSSHGKSKLCQVHSSPHSQPCPGMPSSSFWKDPGAGAPAPAVVVSVVAGADDGDDTGNFYDFTANMSVIGGLTVSETSSATATMAQPSRTGTPVDSQPEENRSSLTVNVARKSVSDKMNPPNNAVTKEAEANSNLPQTIPKPNLSLLTQTAPMRKNSSQNSQTTTLKALPISHPISPKPPISLDHNKLPDTNRNNSHTGAEQPFVHVDNTCPASLTLSPSTPPPTPVDAPSNTSLNLPSVPTPSLIPSNSRPSAIHVPTSVPTPFPAAPSISIKIADLGNATPSTKHYTEDIQTRQYRAPEAILGKRDWDGRADIWSVACVIFELLTAEFLFDPHGQGELFTKDDDHMAQIIELLGDFPVEVKMGGKYSRELFDHLGNLRYIHSLKPWPLKRVMMEKYLYTAADAAGLSDFLLPMLAIDMKQRKRARDMLDHAWLTCSLDDESNCEW